jgi:hypothetical protein
MGKFLKRSFFKEDLQISSIYMKRHSTPLSTEEIQIKTIVSYHPFIPTKIATAF